MGFFGFIGRKIKAMANAVTSSIKAVGRAYKTFTGQATFEEADRLYEDEILWEGFNWTNLNKPECRFKAGLDSILVGTNWPEIYVEMYAIYDVRYFCQSLGLEGNLSIWIPVRYRAKQD